MRKHGSQQRCPILLPRQYQIDLWRVLHIKNRISVVVFLLYFFFRRTYISPLVIWNYTRPFLVFCSYRTDGDQTAAKAKKLSCLWNTNREALLYACNNKNIVISFGIDNYHMNNMLSYAFRCLYRLKLRLFLWLIFNRKYWLNPYLLTRARATDLILSSFFRYYRVSLIRFFDVIFSMSIG